MSCDAAPVQCTLLGGLSRSKSWRSTAWLSFQICLHLAGYKLLLRMQLLLDIADWAVFYAALENAPERTTSASGASSSKGSDLNAAPSLPRREARERELLNAYGQLGDANEVLNERAVAVMKRMSDKLTGRDFSQEGMPNSGDSDSVQTQVQRLIMQATAHDNLCQSYIGWCPFW